MTTTFQIENLKCHGCANTVQKGIHKIDSVQNVSVDVESSTISVDSNEDVTEKIKSELSKMGYPITGEKNSLSHKAKSFVSCAVGRMSDTKE